jgi:hypothetical protein
MVSTRSDVIVIAVRDAEAAQRALNYLKAYQAASPGDFLPSPPLLTDQVLPGVGLAAEPSRKAGEQSFNRVYARALQEALDDTLKTAGAGRKEFGDAVRAKLRQFDIDPDLPHKNLPPGGP